MLDSLELYIEYNCLTMINAESCLLSFQNTTAVSLPHGMAENMGVFWLDSLFKSFFPTILVDEQY